LIVRGIRHQPGQTISANTDEYRVLDLADVRAHRWRARLRENLVAFMCRGFVNVPWLLGIDVVRM
jgi:hypothetical protein